jgi:hypothetical protein
MKPNELLALVLRHIWINSYYPNHADLVLLAGSERVGDFIGQLENNPDALTPLHPESVGIEQDSARQAALFRLTQLHFWSCWTTGGEIYLSELFDLCERLHGKGSTVLLQAYNAQGQSVAKLDVSLPHHWTLRVDGRVAGMTFLG